MREFSSDYRFKKTEIHLIITTHSELYLLKEFRTLISREKIDGGAAHRIINPERNFDKMIDHRSNSSKSTRHPSDYEVLLQYIDLVVNSKTITKIGTSEEVGGRKSLKMKECNSS